MENENQIQRQEHDIIYGVKKVSLWGSDGQGNLLRQLTLGHPIAMRVDEPSSTVTYIGKANVATSNASATWQIFKITVSGTVTSFTWADGDSNYDNVWNDRASLSYS